MDSNAFHALVESLERQGRMDPASLRSGVRRHLWIGHLFLAGVALLLAATAALVFWVLTRLGGSSGPLILGGTTLFVVVVLIGAGLKRWFQRGPSAPGERLERADAPRLWARIDRVQRMLGAPTVHALLISDDFNATMDRHSAFGPYLAGRSHLLLGAPLLYALRPELLDAVIAHEIAHASGPHAAARRRLGRARRVWGHIQHLQSMPIARTPGIRQFTGWYMPRFDAYSIALARLQEFEADAASVRATDARTTARCLATIGVGYRRFETFWKQVWSPIRTSPELPAQSWGLLTSWFRAATREERARALTDMLRETHLVESSHPSLRERLRAIGYDVPTGDASAVVDDLVPSLHEHACAAEHDLGAAAGALIDRWEKKWMEEVAEAWAKHYEDRRLERERIEVLVAKDVSDATSLTAEELWDVAATIEFLEDDATALPWVRRAVAAGPDNARAQFMLGSILARADDIAGIEHLERAMSLDAESVPSATSIIRAFHVARGDAQAAREADSRSEPHFQRLNEEQYERNWAEPSNTFAPPELEPQTRERLIEAAKLPCVKRLWIARKVTQHRTDRPLLVLLVEPTFYLLGTKAATQREALPQQIHQLVSGSGAFDLLIPLTFDHAALRKRMRLAGGMVVDPRRSTITAPPLRWRQRHALALGVVATAAVILALAGLLSMTPRAFLDDRLLVAAAQRRSWDDLLFEIRQETDVDVRIVLESVGPSGDPAARARRVADSARVGRWTAGLGVVGVLDVRSGRLALHATPEMVGITPPWFLRHVEGAYHAAPRARGVPRDLLRATVELLHHRLREASLDPPARPRVIRRPEFLDVGVIRDSTLMATLSAGPSVAAALEAHRRWLRQRAWIPDAGLLTPSSRRHLARSEAMTPPRWELWRHLYATQPMRVEERGNVAIAIPMGDPLVPPLFLSRGPEGWQVDLMAARNNVRQHRREDFSWSLARSGGAFDAPFADLMVEISGHWRFRDGANAIIYGCNCRR